MARRYAARVLLPVLVVLGAALMHTLGHPSGHDDRAGVGGHATATMHEPASRGHPATLAAAAGMAVVAADPATGPDVRLDPLTVCLAILAAGFVLLVAALVMTGRRPLALGLELIRRAVAAAGRGPPARPLGLLLADLSVART